MIPGGSDLELHGRPLGFRWLRADTGDLLIRSEDGRYKRVSADFFSALRDLYKIRQNKKEVEDLLAAQPIEFRNSVSELITDGFVGLTESVEEIPIARAPAIGSRILLFLFGLMTLLYLAFDLMQKPVQD